MKAVVVITTILLVSSPAVAGNLADNGGLGGSGTGNQSMTTDRPGTFSITTQPGWNPAAVPCQSCGVRPGPSFINRLVEAVHGWLSNQPSRFASKFSWVEDSVVKGLGFGVGFGSFRAEPGPTGY